MTSIKRLFLNTIIGMGCCCQAYAIKAYPHPIRVVQPDGSTLMVRLHGDEAAHYATTLDGFMLDKDSKGFYCYVDYDFSSGKKTLTAQRAHNANERMADENALLGGLKNARTVWQDITLRQGRRVMQPYTPLDKGTVCPKTSARLQGKSMADAMESQYLVILVNFTDSTFRFENADFKAWLNERGYAENGASGSVKDYYRDNSSGLFVPNFQVTGPYTLAHPTAYYAANDETGSDQNPRSMVKEACMLAKADNPDLDFAQFDNDGDGMMDNCYIIYAGYSEASTANGDDMWPHSWYMGEEQFTIDGITINNYSCSAELVGQPGLPATPSMDGIGTFTHEFGHILGLKDMYDTDDYVGGYGIDPGAYSLYASGSYNNNSKTPAGLMAFERLQMGWMKQGEEIRPLKEAEDVTLPSLGSSNTARYIDCQTGRTDGTGMEWFVLENRQQEGWDKYIPAHGMLIYHYDYTDERVEKYWSVNGPNNNAAHRCMYIMAADGTDDNFSRTGDTYPGSCANTSFTADSKPAAVNWAGEDVGVDITNITERDGDILFQVNGGASVWTTVKTETPQNICDTAALFTATVAPHGKPVEESGFCWSLNDQPTVSDNHQAAENKYQPELRADNLIPGANYYVRAYMRLQDGTLVYGSTVPFQTECALAVAPFYGDFSSMTNGVLDCWTITDHNQDGTSWEYDKVTEGMLYYGDGYNDADDWLVCKRRLRIPENGALYFVRGIMDEGDVENLDIYVSTTTRNIDDFRLYKRFSFADSYYQAMIEEVDLKEFAGQDIYVALKCSSERLQSAIYIWNIMLMEKLATPQITRFEKSGDNQLAIEWTPIDKAKYYYLCFGKETEQPQFYSIFTPMSFYERVEGDVELTSGSVNFRSSGSVTLKTIPEGVLDLKFMLTSSGPFGSSRLTVQGSKDGINWTDVGPKITIDSYDSEGAEQDWEAYVAGKGYTKLRFNFEHGGRNGRLRYLYLEYNDGKVIDILAEGAVYSESTVINAKTDGEFDSGRYAAWVCSGDGYLFYDDSPIAFYDAEAAAGISDTFDNTGVGLELTRGNIRIYGVCPGYHITIANAAGVTLMEGTAEGESLNFATGNRKGVMTVTVSGERKTFTRKIIVK